jgi:hypothetical protein
VAVTGDGPQVSGPIHAILLACTGRHTALPQLSGAGTHDCTARLSRPSAGTCSTRIEPPPGNEPLSL